MVLEKIFLIGQSAAPKTTARYDRLLMVRCKVKCSGITNKKKIKIHIPKCLLEGLHRRTDNTLANRTRVSVG